MNIYELEAKIMALNSHEQAYLLQKLEKALDMKEEPLTPTELDRRAEDLRKGRVPGIAIDALLASARRLL